MLETLLGCDHVWFYFKDTNKTFTYTNEIDTKFTIRPKFCLKCKAVEWEQVK